MSRIDFIKIVASGNDFVVIKKSPPCPAMSSNVQQSLAKKICDRKYGIGADGLLVLEKSKIADIKMRIFNPDGSEPKMCGNGARCVAALYPKSQVKIETKAGVVESKVNGENVKIKLTEVRGFKLNLPIKVNKRILHVNFINTGVPHTVIFVEGLDRIDVITLGRQIRYHRKFMPAGTNVDFVQIFNNNSIKMRTYERGVENETLACGTGAVAAALVVSSQLSVVRQNKINVQTKSGEILKVYFDKVKDEFKDVWLEGKAKIVYKGRWCDYK